MRRDFAKQRVNQSKSRTRVAQRSAVPKSMIFSVFLLLGLFIATLVFLKTHPTSTKDEAQTKMAAAHKKHHASKPENVAENKPRFDFYTMLPKMRVDAASHREEAKLPPPLAKDSPQANSIEKPEAPLVAKEEESSSSTAKLSATNKQSTPASLKSTAAANVLLQVATLTHFADADQLKAQLTLLGFNVILETTQVTGKTLHRIFVGPFKSESLAKTAQHTLASYNIQSKLYKPAVA